MDHSFKWSIVIGTYNQAKYVPYTFKAIERLTEKDWEVIVCDDGSDDKTREAAESYGIKNLTYFYQPKESFRLTKSMNNGFRNAKGERIVCVMMDSIPKEDLLEQYDKHYEQDRILTGVRYNVKDVEKMELIDKDWRLDKLKDIDLMYVPWRRFTGNNWCASKKLLEDVGYWNEDYRGYGFEDFEFGLRSYIKGYRFTPVTEAIVYHVSHPKRGENEANEIKWWQYEDAFLKKSGIGGQQ